MVSEAEKLQCCNKNYNVCPPLFLRVVKSPVVYYLMILYTCLIHRSILGKVFLARMKDAFRAFEAADAIRILVKPWHFMKQQCHGCHRDSSGWNLAQNIGLASNLDSYNSQRSLLSVGQHLSTIRYERTHQNGSICKCTTLLYFYLQISHTYKITSAIQIQSDN